MGIELSFADSRLREICENFTKAKKTFGKDIAEQIYSRLLDLKACEILSDFPFVIYEENKEKFFLIDSKHKVFFFHNHLSPPINNQVDIDWANMKRIKILRIEVRNDG